MGAGVRERGFTVIEVILFLAIVSALTVGILVTSTVNINNQRYIDAVRSFKALVQEQFVNATRVHNPNDELGSACAAETAEPRGTHDCLLVGKIISVSGGNAIAIRNIIATPPSDERACDPPLITTDCYPGNDLGDLKAMTSFIALDAGSDTLGSQWDTILKTPSPCAGACDVFSIVVMRSPTSGTLYSFFNGGHDLATEPSPNSLDYYIHNLPILPTSTTTICVDSNGLAAWKQQVTIRHGVSGPDAVEESEAAPSC